ncbi:DUF2231 domain-containing protein [Sphingomonas sp.]|jgi:uncharacterized membrane protein|uniref:DUF2231 domain-containing protein n=1 Tax=Sphingomonas sp. TaxID=28214 RepID=UPI002D7E427B|nr:DUF2231 domain-containing protein [Sphingomonas sp.]HEU0043709.1 DUF2231 domain-containing protein [Sphingomonas sp.]
MASTIGRSGPGLLAVAGHAVYPALLPIPIVCFVGVLITDLAYIGSADMMWLDFSTWLLLAGLIGGGIVGVFLIAELVRARRGRTGALSAHFVLLLSAWIVEVFNSFVHARDGWTAVVPTGLTLSLVAVVLSLLAGWFWQSAQHRRNGATS